MNKTLENVNNRLFQNFYAKFDETMNKLYFKNMTSMYKDTETSIGVDKNPDYIPMAESGLDLIKNITYYNDEITKAVQDYTDAIAQAKINIAKLEPIKTEVSGIIKAAQDRRNKELETILGLTINEIKTKYATCFAEENIQFYDADTITNMGISSPENCSDGIDNDLNGFVDSKDIACKTPPGGGSGGGIDIIAPPAESQFGCMIDPKIFPKSSNLPQNKNCLERTIEECELDKYNDGNGNSYSCMFIPTLY
jgi:hypothetical protein